MSDVSRDEFDEKIDQLVKLRLQIKDAKLLKREAIDAVSSLYREYGKLKKSLMGEQPQAPTSFEGEDSTETMVEKRAETWAEYVDAYNPDALVSALSNGSAEQTE